MTHSRGTAGARVPVAVSPAMGRLLETQEILNGFWQTTELSYGYLLVEAPDKFPDLTRPTFDVLGHVESQVWFPNRRGRIKRKVSIGRTLEQVRENTVHVYRATLLSFASAFEAYLEAEVKELRPQKVTSWGAFVQSLSGPDLRAGLEPLPLDVVLRADFCRKIRNKMVHEAFDVPTSQTDPVVVNWRKDLGQRAEEFGWPQEIIPDAIEDATWQVIGRAARGVRKARQYGRELPIEYFYMLFTFTNFNNLAFAIEEAIRPLHSDPCGRVYRENDAIRRRDLIVRSI